MITELDSLLKSLKVPALVLSALLAAGTLLGGAYWVFNLGKSSCQSGYTQEIANAKAENDELQKQLLAEMAARAADRSFYEGQLTERIESHDQPEDDLPAVDIIQRSFDGLRSYTEKHGR